MIKVTNNTSELGLFENDTFSSREELEASVLNWLMETAVTETAAREYMEEYFSEVSWEEEKTFDCRDCGEYI